MITSSKVNSVKVTEVEVQLNALLALLNDATVFVCTRQKPKPDADGSGRTPKEVLTPCLQQHDGEFDKEGRPIFFYGDGCRVVESFCPSCRAYWHVAVARNAMFDFIRVMR